MNLAMTGRMQEGEIVEPVRAAFHLPDNVMRMPSGFQGDEVSADRTAALLSSPENPSPSTDGFDDATLLAPLEVQFPSSIERIRFGFDLGMPPNRNAPQFEQLASLALLPGGFGTEPPCITRMYGEVSPANPALAFLWMTPRSTLLKTALATACW